MDCLFCEIIAGRSPSYKVYEDETAFAFLNIGPVCKGHTLVVPKMHAQNLSVGSRDDAIHIMAVVHDLAPRIMAALGATGYNLGMNHGKSAGQEVMHTHVHIMPCYDGLPRTSAKAHPSPEELEKVSKAIVDNSATS